MSNSYCYENLMNSKTSDLDDIDNFLGDDHYNFNQVDELETKIKMNNKSHIPLARKVAPNKSELKPDVFFAILKKDSIIYSVGTQDLSPIRASKQVIVRAKEIYYGGTYSHLYDKKYKILYKTKSHNLISIDEDVKLHPKFDPNITYKHETHYLSNDHIFKFQNEINLAFENHNITPLATNHGLESTMATANSAEYKIYPKTKLPFDMGIGLTLQSGNFVNESEYKEDDHLFDAKWSALYLGLSLKYNIYNYNEIGFNIETGIKRSLFYNLKYEKGNIEYNNSQWLLGAEADYKTVFGKVALGFLVINQNFSVSSTKNLIIDQENISNRSSTGVSIYIGHRFEIQL